MNQIQMRSRIVLTFLVLFLLISRHAAPFPTLSITLPAVYRPGGGLPDAARCSDFYYDYINMYCASPDYNISFQYNRRTGQIDHSTLSLNGFRIGDFLLAWGTPSGVLRHTPEIAQVFWGGRSVWVIGAFVPQAKVILYEEYIEPPPLSEWQGFIDYTVSLTVTY